MSVRASASAPSSCSGAMYWNVPRIVPAVVSGFASVGSAVEPETAPSPAPERARPKSRSFAPVFVSITLPGLRSRWTMPCLCAALRASATCAPNFTTWSSGSGPFCSRSASDSPSSSSITRKCASPSCPTSKSVQMCGWLSEEIVFASRSKRWRRSSSSAKPVGRILTATLRSRRVSLPSPDLAHPAGADRRQELVRPEPRAGLRGHESAEYSPRADLP